MSFKLSALYLLPLVIGEVLVRSPGALLLDTEPVDTDVMEGGTATLTCSVSQSLLESKDVNFPSFRWLYSEDLPKTVLSSELKCSNCAVNRDGLLSTLVLINVHHNQTGYYQCEATSEPNTVYSGAIKLRVHFIENTAPLQIMKKDIQDHLEAFVVELDHCNTHTINSYPESKARWKVEGNFSDEDLATSWTSTEDTLLQDISGSDLIRTQISRNSFIIYNLLPLHGTLTYTCLSFITFNSTNHEVPVVTWTIQGADDYNFLSASPDYNYMTNVITESSSPVVSVGDDYTLSCSCAGYQFPEREVRFEWWREGEMVVEGAVWELRNLTLEQNGKFVCTARIGQMKQSKPFWLTVVDVPDPASIYFIETPQKIWHIAVAAGSFDKPFLSEDSEIARRVEGADLDLTNTRNRRNTGFNFIVDISPVCLASKGWVQWTRNGVDVKHPLILPPLPKKYLTFQCFASGENGNIQQSIVALVDETSPVVMNFTKMNETDEFLLVECSGKAFPPPKIDLEVSVTPAVEGSSIFETSQTTSTYYSVLVAKLRKHLEMTIECTVHNQYYSQTESLSFSFPDPPSPTLPQTQPPQEPTDVSNPVTEKENEVEIKQKTVPEDVSDSKGNTDVIDKIDDILTTEDASTSADSNYKTLLIYIISGVIAALLILILLVCLVVRRTRTHRYQGMRKREVRGGTITSTSFTPYSKSPTPEDYYDIPTSHSIRKPPRSLPPSSKNNSLKREKELSLKRGSTYRDSSLKMGIQDSSLRRNGSIHPADDLEEYTDMKTFGSLKRKTGHHTELETRATLHGVYVLPAPPKIPTPKYLYSQIKKSAQRADSHDARSESRDPVYDNVDEEDLYDTPPHRPQPYSPPFKSQETKSEYDKIEVDMDNSVQYDNMLRTGEPGTPFSDI